MITESKQKGRSVFLWVITLISLFFALASIIKFVISTQSVKQDDGELLHIALMEEDVGNICILINSEAAVNAFQRKFQMTPLSYSIKYNDYEMCKQILVHRPDLLKNRNKMGESPIIQALYGGKDDRLLFLLIEHSTTIDEIDELGRNSLQIAIITRRNPKLISCLINRNTELFSYNREGWNALTLASAMGNNELVIIMFEKLMPGDNKTTDQVFLAKHILALVQANNDISLEKYLSANRLPSYSEWAALSGDATVIENAKSIDENAHTKE